MVYAYYASYIAREIFPSSNAYASLMMTLGTFGAGYLMRPLGAVVLGAYVDRVGRRAGLILTLIFDGHWHAGDRVHARISDHRDRRSDCGAAWPVAAGVFRRRRSRRRVRLSFGDGDARTSRILLRMAIGEPADRGGFRRAARCGAQRGRAARRHGPVGLARSIFHRLPDCAAAVLAAPVAGGDGSISRAKASSRQFRKFSPRSRPTGKLSASAYCFPR